MAHTWCLLGQETGLLQCPQHCPSNAKAGTGNTVWTQLCSNKTICGYQNLNYILFSCIPSFCQTIEMFKNKTRQNLCLSVRQNQVTYFASSLDLILFKCLVCFSPGEPKTVYREESQTRQHDKTWNRTWLCFLICAHPDKKKEKLGGFCHSPSWSYLKNSDFVA